MVQGNQNSMSLFIAKNNAVILKEVEKEKNPNFIALAKLF